MAEIDASDWDGCAVGDNPFVSHAFLSALESSGSATAKTGWQPAPILVEDDGRLVGAAPAWLKSHSQGEYVFDHGWAEAWARAGGEYYPKLLIASPFSPVPGPRLLTTNPDAAQVLIGTAEQLVIANDLSSAHANFVTADQVPLFETAGWLTRQGTQYHWRNASYGDFDDFLAALSSRKRKAIRHERAAAQQRVEIVRLTGNNIMPAHWDAFWHFYQDTGARKWGRPYLTRDFFRQLGENMADEVLLVLALRDGQPIAGALNLIGPDTLYGRYWGCTEDVPFLHFELCYYQAIEAAIAMGLSTVEAGAQGEHKLARGYLPTPTWSAHFIPHDGFRAAVADFLVRERRAVAADAEFLEGLTPFRRG